MGQGFLHLFALQSHRDSVSLHQYLNILLLKIQAEKNLGQVKSFFQCKFRVHWSLHRLNATLWSSSEKEISFKTSTDPVYMRSMLAYFYPVQNPDHCRHFVNTEEKPNKTLNIPTKQGVYSLTHDDRPTDGHIIGEPADSSASIISETEQVLSAQLISQPFQNTNAKK